MAQLALNGTSVCMYVWAGVIGVTSKRFVGG
jgi:hypothetical protein